MKLELMYVLDMMIYLIHGIQWVQATKALSLTGFINSNKIIMDIYLIRDMQIQDILNYFLTTL